jgi:hypothetical protein
VDKASHAGDTDLALRHFEAAALASSRRVTGDSSSSERLRSPLLRDDASAY